MKELNLICFITNITASFLCGALLPILPALTRKTLLFGVKIPAEESGCPEAKNMKSRYIRICLLGTALVLALCVIQFIVWPNMTLMGTLYFPLLFIPIQMTAFIPNWKRAVRLKETRGWKVPHTIFADTNSSHSRGTLSELPWGWYAVSLLLFLIVVIVTSIRYPDLPDIIPTHWGADMQPDAWGDKSFLTVFSLPLMSAGMLALMWVSGALFVKAKLQIDPQNPALSFAQHRMYRRQMGNCLGFLTLSITVMCMILSFAELWPETAAAWVSLPLMLALPSAPTVLLIVVSVRAGQGGCRLKPKTAGTDPGYANDTPENKAAGRGDDRYWILGMFYCNPEDPSHFVEDRFGSNLGFNYARLSVKISAAIALLSFIAGYAWLTVWLLANVL